MRTAAFIVEQDQTLSNAGSSLCLKLAMEGGAENAFFQGEITMATKAKKASARKKTARSTSRAAKRGAATKRRKPTMRAGARKAVSTRKSPVARVKSVTREVVQQATVAVTAGVETLKDLGGQLVDRVRA